MSNLEKLVNVVNEDHAPSLLKLYSKIVEYKDFLTEHGYDDDVNQVIDAIVKNIDEIMEED